MLLAPPQLGGERLTGQASASSLGFSDTHLLRAPIRPHRSLAVAKMLMQETKRVLSTRMSPRDRSLERLLGFCKVTSLREPRAKVRGAGCRPRIIGASERRDCPVQIASAVVSARPRASHTLRIRTVATIERVVVDGTHRGGDVHGVRRAPANDDRPIRTFFGQVGYWYVFWLPVRVRIFRGRIECRFLTPLSLWKRDG